MTMARTAVAFAVLVGASSAVPVSSLAATGQDALARAKDLYTSAAYDEALVALSEYRPTPTDVVEADEYRAFCLLALGRVDDATKVIEQIVADHPSFQPPEALASPRVQEAFRNVRRRLLPTIARQAYVDAKDAYDRSDFDVAAKSFDRVLTLLKDPDVATSGDLADLRLLSQGFGELIEKTKAVVPPQPAPQPPPTPPTPTPDTDHVYGAEDHDVTPPVAISQTVPPWRQTTASTETYEVILVVLIDETGSVVSVRVEGTLRPPYDGLLRQAATHWKYRPAMRNGRPVKFQKAVAIKLAPGSGR